MSHHPRSSPPTLGAPQYLKERALNIPNEVKKDAATVESNNVRPWHKSAPWLISAVTILGLLIVFQR